MYSICCTPPEPDYRELTPEEKQRFGKIVHDLRKSGVALKSAQVRAYQIVLLEGFRDVD